MPSATIAVGDVMWALPEELFSAEGAKCIGDQLANLLSADDPNANRSRQTYKSTSTRYKQYKYLLSKASIL